MANAECTHARRHRPAFAATQCALAGPRKGITGAMGRYSFSWAAVPHEEYAMPPRHRFLRLTTTFGAAALMAEDPAPARAAAVQPGGVAFDAFALFDTGPLAALAEGLFPASGSGSSTSGAPGASSMLGCASPPDGTADFCRVAGDTL